MVSDLDVIIGRDARPLPFRIAIGRRRQRIERRTLDRLQELVAALADAAHDLVVDGHYAVTDRGVQLGQREEAAMAQLRQHEALDDLDRDLDLRLGESRQMLLVSEQRWGKKSASRTSS